MLILPQRVVHLLLVAAAAGARAAPATNGGGSRSRIAAATENLAVIPGHVDLNHVILALY
jgi:hypothetical protein